MILKHPTCPSCCDGEITIKMSASGKPYLFSIDGGTTWKGADVYMGSYATFTGLCVGTYDVMVNLVGNLNRPCIATDKVELMVDTCYVPDDPLDCSIPETFLLTETDDFTFYADDGVKTFVVNYCCTALKVTNCNQALTVNVDSTGCTTIEEFVQKIADAIQGSYPSTDVIVEANGKRLKLLIKKGFLPVECICENTTWTYSWDGAEEVPFSLSSLACCSYDKECSNPDDKFSFTVDVNVGLQGGSRDVSLRVYCDFGTVTFPLGTYTDVLGNPDLSTDNLVSAITANAIIGGYDIVATKVSVEKIKITVGVNELPEGCECAYSQAELTLGPITNQQTYFGSTLNCCTTADCPECETCLDCPCVNIDERFSAVFTGGSTLTGLNPLNTYRATLSVVCGGIPYAIIGSSFLGNAALSGNVSSILTTFPDLGVNFGPIGGLTQMFRLYFHQDTMGVCTCETLDDVLLIVEDITVPMTPVVVDTLVGDIDCCINNSEYPTFCPDCPEAPCFNPDGWKNIHDVYINESAIYPYGGSGTVTIFMEFACNGVVVNDRTHILSLSLGATQDDAVQEILLELSQYNPKRLYPEYWRLYIPDTDLAALTGGCDCEDMTVTVYVYPTSFPIVTTIQPASTYPVDCCTNTLEYNICNNCFDCPDTCSEDCPNVEGFYSTHLNTSPAPAVFDSKPKQFKIKVICSDNTVAYTFIGVSVTGVTLVNFQTKVKESLAAANAYIVNKQNNNFRIGLPTGEIAACPDCNGTRLELSMLHPGYGVFSPAFESLIAANNLDCCLDADCPESFTNSDCECQPSFDATYYNPTLVSMPAGTVIEMPILASQASTATDVWFYVAPVNGLDFTVTCCSDCVYPVLNSIYYVDLNTVVAPTNGVDFFYTDWTPTDQVDSTFLQECGTEETPWGGNWKFGIRIPNTAYPVGFAPGVNDTVILTFEVEFCGQKHYFSSYYKA